MTQEQATVELKPCPFCGASLSLRQPRIGDDYHEHPKNVCVLAGDVFMSDPLTFFDTPGALEAWNRRAERLAAPAVPAEQAQPASAATASPEAEWQDKRDRWTSMIDASHPMKTGTHDAYATALEMVGNRHSKGALVELVCWLVQRADAAEARLRAAAHPVQASSAAPSDAAPTPRELLEKAHNALDDLLDDTQHAEHPDCDDGPCPVREARAVLVELHAALSTAAAPEGQPRMPLSEERIIQLANEHTWFNGSHAVLQCVRFARAIEAEHGIPPEGGEKGGNHG